MPKLLHIGIHNSKNKNAGDTVLFAVVRRLFENMIPDCNWVCRQLWDPFTIDDALKVNSDFDAVVIGGGGLLLRDQEGSDTSDSGWQWNSKIEAVSAVKVPLFLFAVGYNRFRGQEDFDPVFSDHISVTLGASSFFGLRNQGSIDAVKRYVPDELQHRIKMQPCPTLVIWQLYEAERRKAKEQMEARQLKQRQPILAVNTAFDREKLRFAEGKSAFLNSLAKVLKRAEESACKIHLVAHKSADLDFVPFLERANVNFEIYDLTEASVEAVIDYYTLPDLVVGMRGHSQMIPLGLRKPIFSIISHDKMRFLLDDINRPGWGADIEDPNFGIKLIEFMDRVLNRSDDALADVAEVQASIWRHTSDNMKAITDILASDKRSQH